MANSKLIWALLGGVVIGAVGATTLKRGKLKPGMTRLMSYGYDLKDCLVEECETLKENVEDMAAEAKEQAELRKARKNSEQGLTPEVTIEAAEKAL